MKKYNLFFLMFILAGFFFACGSKENKTAQGNNASKDVVGEADSISHHSGRASESTAKATINGREVEFKFMDNYISNEPTFTLTESADGKFATFAFELGSDEKLREKIGIMLINYPLSKATLPLIISSKQEGKQIKLDLNIQKSSVFISYTNQDNFTCSITAVTDTEVEGNFFGEVRNAGNRIIKVENGYFKVKIKKAEMKLQ